jgi:hypothetical protein
MGGVQKKGVLSGIKRAGWLRSWGSRPAKIWRSRSLLSGNNLFFNAACRILLLPEPTHEKSTHP